MFSPARNDITWRLVVSCSCCFSKCSQVLDVLLCITMYDQKPGTFEAVMGLFRYLQTTQGYYILPCFVYSSWFMKCFLLDSMTIVIALLLVLAALSVRLQPRPAQERELKVVCVRKMLTRHDWTEKPIYQIQHVLHCRISCVQFSVPFEGCGLGKLVFLLIFGQERRREFQTMPEIKQTHFYIQVWTLEGTWRIMKVRAGKM